MTEEKKKEEQTSIVSNIKKCLNFNFILEDKIYIYAFISVITYSVIFYFGTSDSKCALATIIHWICLFLPENIIILLEPIIGLISWILFIIISNKGISDIGQKRNKYCIFYFVLTFISTLILYNTTRGHFFTLFCFAWTISTVKLIFMYLLLSIVNLFIERLMFFYNKYFKAKKNTIQNRIFLIISLIFVITIILNVYLYIQKPKLNIARYNHSAVELKDGRIFITGGETIKHGQHVVLNSAEIFDPKTKKTTLLSSSMHKKRTTHASVLLQNGNVLIIGGDKNNSSAEIFNPETNTFKQIINLNNQKMAVSAKIIDKNKVVIYDTLSNKLEIYDTETSNLYKIGEIINGNYYILPQNIIFLMNKIYLPISSLSTKEKNNDTNTNITSNENVYKDPYKVMAYYDLTKKKINYISKIDYNSSLNCHTNSINQVENNIVLFCGNNRNLYAQRLNTSNNSWEGLSNKLDITPDKIYSLNLTTNKILLVITELSKTTNKDSFVIYDSQKNKLFYIKPFISQKLRLYTINKTLDNKIIVTGGLEKGKKVSKTIKIINLEELLNDKN